MVVGSDPLRDQARRSVAARGLTPAAVAHLTRDALGRIALENLAPVKGLLKHYFSDEPWTEADDRQLAELVGLGEGWWSYTLEDDLDFAFGWRDGAFRMDLGAGDALADTFAGSVVPEATPNPRTIRFVTGPIHTGPSRWYESAEGVDDARVTRLFTEFSDDVANVLVGPEFVAVGLRRPDRWEQLLVPVLRTVEAEFAPAEGTAQEDATAAARSARPEVTVGSGASGGPERAFDRAWQQLGALRPDDPEDLERIVAAVSADDASVRQVAARVLVDADPDVAAREWGRLLDDTSRSVRRATVDAMVDAERASLRPLLERALHDTDAWTRWKALRGLVELGIAASRDVVVPLAGDPDFRVRLEAASALRGVGG
jgi:hypothetical protein